ncbi:MADS-box protein SOC1-like isoform X2 [Mangifera indica]|uniref:MADS-box protein SOC1-like isoform X2 n=1 Tax=Mangifera indica TaxID=29780 RepID=UPI001CFBE35A|nr:MADS-box protein SOC1-like isoform X2 [Mangifera indica]
MKSTGTAEYGNKNIKLGLWSEYKEGDASNYRKAMVRGKIQMKRIENATSRQVTFSKRRNGLLKKAYELSVLCESEVAAIIFSQKGRVYEFSSSGMQKTIDRYFEYKKEVLANKPETEEGMQHDIANMVKEIERIEVSQRKLLGKDLDSCSVDELLNIDGQLKRSLRSIRARKAELFKEKTEQLKAKEKLLLEENDRLSLKEKLFLEENERLSLKPWQTLAQQKGATHNSQSSQSSKIDTELSIGPTEIRFF